MLRYACPLLTACCCPMLSLASPPRSASRCCPPGVLTFKDVNVEELATRDFELPKELVLDA